MKRAPRILIVLALILPTILAAPTAAVGSQMLPGKLCDRNHLFTKYDMCISGTACDQAAGLNPAYVTRLQNILSEARQNGIVAELVLFEAYFMGRHHDVNALYAKNPWNPL